MKREPKWKRITAQSALDLLRELERHRLAIPSSTPIDFVVRKVVDALDSHVRAELTRRRR